MYDDRMTERKFHKTIIHVEILSEEPLTGDESLEQVAYNIVDGDWSGNTQIVMHEELDGKEAANALINQGSDPGFFRLTDAGDDVE